MPHKEPQYDACDTIGRIKLGSMVNQVYHNDPKRLGFVLARYKFVSKMLADYKEVAEIGCGDGFASRIVEKSVKALDKYDFDADFCRESGAKLLDITQSKLPEMYDAIYMLDVFEHITTKNSVKMLFNITDSLKPDGVFIVGTPSLESQKYASPQSKAGHVNCLSGENLKLIMKSCFKSVFLFGQNDEMIHVGFAPMCHYLIALCVGPRYTYPTD